MSEQLPFTRGVAASKMACSFAEAATRQPLDRQPQPMVTYFLVGHALELAWKSVLIAEGTTKSTLRRIGHDLRKARRRAEEALESGVPTSPEVASVTEMVADYYAAKALEYVEVGYYSLPDATQAVYVVDQYVEAVRAWVDQRVRERLQLGDSPE